MKKASLNVLSVRAGMTAAEKASMFADFNDPNSNVNMLLLNTMVGAAGLNLHHQCHFEILVQMPWSYGSVGQCVGRLVRIGQGEPVTWVIVSLEDTVYNFLEHRASIKEVQSLGASIRFPKHLNNPFVRKLLSYEMLCLLLSQPFNRMVWEYAHPSKIQDFNSQSTRDFAKFYSRFARLLLAVDPNDLPEHYKEILLSANELKIALPLAYLDNYKDKPLPDELAWDELWAACSRARQPDIAEQAQTFAPETEFGTATPFKNAAPAYKSPSPPPGNTDGEDSEAPGSPTLKERKPKSQANGQKSPASKTSKRKREDDPADQSGGEGPSNRRKV
jgi:hypothetical protein